jgi:hypothetical protein
VTSLSQIDVPELTPDEIEAAATELLRQYAQKFDVEITAPVPVERIAEIHLQLILEFKDMKALFPMAEVHGAIWFSQEIIGIDQRLDPELYPLMLGRYRFTLAHEVGHWCLHRHLFIPAEIAHQGDLLIGEHSAEVICRKTSKRRPIERQADEFAANLLMPRSLIRKAWAEFRFGSDEEIHIATLRDQYQGRDPLFRGRKPESQQERDLAIKEDFAGPLAEQFAVSREAMRIRLEELELIVESSTARFL